MVSSAIHYDQVYTPITRGRVATRSQQLGADESDVSTLVAANIAMRNVERSDIYVVVTCNEEQCSCHSQPEQAGCGTDTSLRPMFGKSPSLGYSICIDHLIAYPGLEPWP
jgi:hypothetical protein